MIANKPHKIKLLFDGRALEERSRKPVVWMREQANTLPNTNKPFVNEQITRGGEV
jgi:hypothetical protein